MPTTLEGRRSHRAKIHEMLNLQEHRMILQPHTAGTVEDAGLSVPWLSGTEQNIKMLGEVGRDLGFSVVTQERAVSFCGREGDASL